MAKRLTAEGLARAFGKLGVPVSRNELERVRHRNKFAVFSAAAESDDVPGVETRSLRDLLLGRS
jgi:hypothetical protein